MTEEHYLKYKKFFTSVHDEKGLKKLEEIWKKQQDGSMQKETEERRKKEEIAKKEEEVRALLQKDPDDLTGREVKRLKELQNDPDIDMEDFLTIKEYQKLISIIGEPKKEEPSEMSLFGHPIQFDKQ